MFKNIFLYIYGIHPAAVPDDSGSGSRIMTAAGSKIANFHSLSKPKLKHILFWRTKSTHTI
jgi:hypothetical protein